MSRQLSSRQARAKLAAGDLPHQEQRRLRKLIRAREISARRRHLEVRHIALAAAGALAAMAIVGAAFALGPAIAAARGQGTSGTFIVRSQVCSRAGCTWVGTFESAAGVVIPSVAYEGSLPAGAQPGSRIAAIDPGESSHVFAPHGSRVWLPDLLLTLLIGGGVGIGLWIFPIPVVRKRRDTQGAG